MAGEEDRLRAINDELRGQGDEPSPWLPLESNPEVFSQFAHSVGLPAAWGWHDVPRSCEELLFWHCTSSSSSRSDRFLPRSSLAEASLPLRPRLGD